MGCTLTVETKKRGELTREFFVSYLGFGTKNLTREMTMSNSRVNILDPSLAKISNGLHVGNAFVFDDQRRERCAEGKLL